ncbi:YunC family protein [Methanoculleus chikugoensis]|uniref:YunC family protein n=1 Tax=Methanoculleus chikugoensis TaxID=118126 RepID=UPI000A732491|nr:YunC family protein [Methanoculleus chikugoensis]
MTTSGQLHPMQHETVRLTGKDADGYVIPLGPVNLVAVVTDAGGMVGCGAFDVDALERFGYPPAARVKPAGGASSIETVEDLLRGEIKGGANRHAEERGVAVGMTGREALDRL